MARSRDSLVCGMPVVECRRLIRSALAEDTGGGDITSRAVIAPVFAAEGSLVAKAAGVVAGLPLLPVLFRTLDAGATVKLLKKDGDRVAAGDGLATIRARARALLAGERVALNLVQHLSGVASLTERFVREVRGTRAKIVDTRKTTPGLRLAEKYAVRMGGGRNHRLRLDDLVLIKDNHLAILGGGNEAIWLAMSQCRPLQERGVRVEVETRCLAEALFAAHMGADIIMLDNMAPAAMRRVVRAIRAQEAGRRRSVIEASGGISLRNVASVARTGVDWISVGALTHSAPGLDISLEIAVTDWHRAGR